MLSFKSCFLFNMKHPDWTLQVMWKFLTNQSALFQRRVVTILRNFFKRLPPSCLKWRICFNNENISSRSHTPSGKRAKNHPHQQPDDSDATWNNNNNGGNGPKPVTTATPTSASTGDTVIPRRLPPPPPQNSSTSTSTTDKSLPRSMPYYEVPASRVPAPAVPMASSQPPPHRQQSSSYQNGAAAFTSDPSSLQRPYTQINRGRLIWTFWLVDR